MTFEKLEFNRLKECIKSYCVSSLGKELIDKIAPTSNINIVKRKLNENIESRNILFNTTYIPLEGLFNVSNTLEKVEKGMILDASELINIEDFLRGCLKIKKFMLNNEFYAPKLSSYALNITECSEIQEEINFAIKNNRVDSNASKDLKKIRKNIEINESKAREKINKFLVSSSNKKYIQEFIITKRDDRYVIPIKSSYKNEIEGTILDTSSKGNTVFIEPVCVSKYSSELISLKSDESIEEYKILSLLTEMIYDKVSQINLNLEIIAEFDMIFAKAKYSQSNGCITPKINNRGYIKIVDGKHPLLSNDSIPLNFEIGETYRSLVITGPNAGGKTVALKTIGILTLMVQCGIDVCVSNSSEFSLFDNIFVDIGDNQSIENSLSTFSSHLKNISDIMKSCKKSSLLLFDEIGSGTEPNEGAGLAIAMLEEFYKMKCITVATTHYSEIKKFAKMHPDFENAGMLFDKETLQPMYKLTIGKSQNSNALYIAEKMGLKSNVIKRATDYIEEKTYNIDVIPKEKKINIDIENNKSNKDTIEYSIGDRVKLLDEDDFGIIYKPVDKHNNVEILYNGSFVIVNIKKIELSLKAINLYPQGYNLNELFISYEKRKLDKDIERGSKKALKKIQKEIKKNNAKD